jgi:hypothetical protein
MQAMTPKLPGIRFSITGRGVEILQQRPALTDVLGGMKVNEALQQIPLLLPVCGQAQSVAALRAVASARGEPETDAQVQQRQQTILLEQARAAAWRLAIDWPDLVAAPRELAGLREVHRSQGAAAHADALMAFLPGLDAVTSLDSLMAWVQGSECVAAQVIQRALRQQPVSVSGSLSSYSLAGAELAVRAPRALAMEPYDPLQPHGGPAEVGPLAMARDPLITALSCEPGLALTCQRLLAQVLDTRYIAAELHKDPSENTGGSDAGSRSPGPGLGVATTARGPVFHRVQLEADSNRVADWRVLAPTDWHCSNSGPLMDSVADCVPTPEALRLLVAGFDPCVAWEVVSGEQGHA